MSRRLYRSNRDRILGGVAGGIGEYFDVDPTLVRLAWVILALAGGFGVLAYIIAWLIIPEAPRGPRDFRDERGPRLFEGPGEAGGGESAGTSGGCRAGEASCAAADWDEDVRYRYHDHRAASWLFGAVLVGLGLLLLVHNLWPFLWTFPFWPIVLILIGVLLLTGGLHRDHDGRRDRRDRR